MSNPPEQYTKVQNKMQFLELFTATRSAPAFRLDDGDARELETSEEGRDGGQERGEEAVAETSEQRAEASNKAGNETSNEADEESKDLGDEAED